MEVLKTSKVVYVFQVFWIIKNKIYISTHQIYVPTILIEWKNLFRIKSLNVKFSIYQKQSSCKKRVVKNVTKLIEQYPWCSFKFSKFQAKGLQLYWKETPVYVISQEFCICFKNNYFVERRQILLKYFLKFRIAAPDKFSEATVLWYFLK